MTLSPMRGRFLMAAFAALAFALGACATPPPPRPDYPPISFRDKAPLSLKVGEVRIETRYRAPGVAPNVDHLFPARILDAAQAWPKDRLVAAGTGLRLDYTILDASVIAVKLKKSGGLKGLVTKDQSERYDARAAVEIRILDTSGAVVATARAEAVRSRSVREDVTLSEREKVWYEIARDIMAELDRQLEQTIKAAFHPYLN